MDINNLPLIEIVGLSRYDLPACIVTVDMINNWSKYLSKLNLTKLEKEILYKLIKSELNASVKEINGKNGIMLKFSKLIDSEIFNNLFRKFINNHKICTKCNTPELIDMICNACGTNLNDLNKKDKNKKIKE
jgi:translation initiation factor 2 beta subunit (eIF-2beta)/eIF-5